MSEEQNYTVLARKYRPKKLEELIGQEALVRTLNNALKSGRLAHAFLLTGIRGVGKTSTARIIARKLNEIPDNEPVDSHIDVVEMDAASNTGVDNIREIIESAKYKPLSAPYKIYIIDEVHMLSKGAFNALLKTLEEPPAHVKFIFATTEIRKVPVTILSRCQRFDLPRVDTEIIAEHINKIARKEKVNIEEGAVSLLSTASEGSVRDALSLFDQAIAHSDGIVTVENVQLMLGFADKGQIISLFEQFMTGNISETLELYSSVAKTSAEPMQIIQDLMGFCHLVTRYKITPDLQADGVTQEEMIKGKELAEQLSMSALTFVWQMLVKAVEELRFATNPRQVAEMALIRISYATENPDPNSLLKAPKPTNASQPKVNGNGVETDVFESPTTYAQLVELFKKGGELLTYNYLKTGVHLVSFAPEKLEIRIEKNIPSDLTNKITQNLRAWTSKNWMVVVSNEEGESTLAKQEESANDRIMRETLENQAVKKVLEFFPDAKISDIQMQEDANDKMLKVTNETN